MDGARNKCLYAPRGGSAVLCQEPRQELLNLNPALSHWNSRSQGHPGSPAALCQGAASLLAHLAGLTASLPADAPLWWDRAASALPPCHCCYGVALPAALTMVSELGRTSGHPSSPQHVLPDLAPREPVGTGNLEQQVTPPDLLWSAATAEEWESRGRGAFPEVSASALPANSRRGPVSAGHVCSGFPWA